MSFGVPLWMPARTRTLMPPGHLRSRSVRWIASAACTAAEARGKAAKNSSARASTSTPSRGADGIPHQGPHVVEDADVAVSEHLQESRGGLDVGEQERDEAGREFRRLRRRSRSHLPRHETDRDDAVLPRREEESLERLRSGVVVLELHLVEPGERCPHVALVVDGQTPAPLPIDIRKRTVGKLPSLSRS